MITLYVAGPNFGLPESSSSFVTKAEVLLKMSGVPYRREVASFSKAPKGKIPYVEDCRLLGDFATFLRFHLEDNYGTQFDKELTEAEKATAWAYEKMCEDHLTGQWSMRAGWKRRISTKARACSSTLHPRRSAPSFSPWSNAGYASISTVTV